MAGLMGAYQDVAIFRRFGSLATLNLLSLQSEIEEIEQRVQILFKADDGSAESAMAQKDLLGESRKKLQEYRECTHSPVIMS